MKIGILGGGQLARLMILSGYQLGFEFVVMDPSSESCAGKIADFICAEFTDRAALDHLANQVDVITFDFENVPVQSVEYLEKNYNVFPSSKALKYSQDRLLEKQLLTEFGLQTTDFFAVDSENALRKGLEKLKFPCVLKTRRLGYDGKGQAIINDESDVLPAWQKLAGHQLLLEKFVHFQRELSIITVRDRQGNCQFYPCSENVHKDGILRTTLVPITPSINTERLQSQIIQLLRHLDYVGVFALELFECKGQLLVNEMAPRVHNTGHWTLNGAVTSQFENHLRAITNLTLGLTNAIGYTGMINCLGNMPAIDQLAVNDRLHWYDYGKIPKPMRKLGHINFSADNMEQLDHKKEQLLNNLVNN